MKLAIVLASLSFCASAQKPPTQAFRIDAWPKPSCFIDKDADENFYSSIFSEGSRTVEHVTGLMIQFQGKVTQAEVDACVQQIHNSKPTQRFFDRMTDHNWSRYKGVVRLWEIYVEDKLVAFRAMPEYKPKQPKQQQQ